MEISPATHPAEPPVRRFWWLKRLSLAGLTLLILLAITWAAWDQYSRRELQARIDAYRMAGEPTTVMDLQTPAVPHDQNAAALYKQAAAALSTTVLCPAAGNKSFDVDIPYPPEWHTLARRAIEANPQALELARQASLRNGADWATGLRSPLLDKLTFSGLKNQRDLAQLLADTALYEHFQGDDARAMADIRVILHQARTVGRYPFLTPDIVSCNIEVIALVAIEIMAGDLRIGARSSTSGLSTEISQGEVRGWISELLNGRQVAENFARATRENRVEGLDLVDNIYRSSLLFKPTLRLRLIGSMDRLTDLARVSAMPTLPAALATLAPLSRQQYFARYVGLDWGSKKPVDPAFQTWAIAIVLAIDDSASSTILSGILYPRICEQRMAAVMLAFRMYVIDHGQYPQALRELVPEYLPALPADPMAADGRPFGYLIAMDGKRPVLYSVGEDGIDQTQGSEPDFPPYLLKGNQRMSRQKPNDDQYRDLSSCSDSKPLPPMPPTSNPFTGE